MSILVMLYGCMVSYVKRLGRCKIRQEKAKDAKELTPKQHLLIAQLLKGLSIPLAAESCGIAERTARYWWQLPHVRQAYRQAREELFESVLEKTMAELLGGIPDVLAVL